MRASAQFGRVVAVASSTNCLQQISQRPLSFCYNTAIPFFAFRRRASVLLPRRGNIVIGRHCHQSGAHRRGRRNPRAKRMRANPGCGHQARRHRVTAPALGARVRSNVHSRPLEPSSAWQILRPRRHASLRDFPRENRGGGARRCLEASFVRCSQQWQQAC